jgi:hypothetical protein
MVHVSRAQKAALSYCRTCRKGVVPLLFRWLPCALSLAYLEETPESALSLVMFQACQRYFTSLPAMYVVAK